MHHDGRGLNAEFGSGLLIEEEFEVVLAAYFTVIQPDLSLIWCDHLYACHLDGPYALTISAVCLRNGSEPCFCFPGYLHALVGVLLERVMCVHPHGKVVCHLCIALYSLVSDSYHCCQIGPAVFPVSSSEHE